MINKLTALALSAIMTVGLVAAAAPTVTTKDTDKQVEIKTDRMVSACAQAYINYRAAVNAAKFTTRREVDGGYYLKQATDQFPAEQKFVVTLICFGYGRGYDDGARGEV